MKVDPQQAKASHVTEYVYKTTCLVLAAAAYGAGVGSNAQAGAYTSAMDSQGYELTLASRSVAQQIDPGIASPHAVKFVQFEVADVINPDKIPLAFYVHYRPLRGEESFLGTFSLFPPDNPGKFIVATQGRLEPGGTIVVSLTPLEESRGQNGVRVRLKRISFIRE
jgi:hypothetical protein